MARVFSMKHHTVSGPGVELWFLPHQQNEESGLEPSFSGWTRRDIGPVVKELDGD